jgi:flavin reductase (DIM6/NTAB) family NADH-FMN oxidoreductase RutF
MPNFKSLTPTDFSSVFDRLNKDWMLITAGDGSYSNSMTASWGAFGILWNKPVAICFIRPQRHTFALAEQKGGMALSFFDEEWKKALSYMGKFSGRDGDKHEACGMTIALSEDGIPYPEQARTVLLCRKLYASRLEENGFIDPALIEKNYPQNDFHQMYVCSIEAVLQRED